MAKITLNAIVESGPFIPKYSQETNSTWELKYSYISRFKWGGPQISDKEVKNPKDLDTYDVPDTIQTAIQIVNPEKQTPETIFHPWDYRRGLLKSQLLKECAKTSQLIQSFNVLQQKYQKRKREEEQPYKTHRKKHKKCRNISNVSAKKIHAKHHKQKTSSSSSTSSKSSSSESSTQSSSSSWT